MLLALVCAQAVAQPTGVPGTVPHQQIDYPEGAVARVLTLAAPANPGDLESRRRDSERWRLSGPDAARFRILAGALRFAARPDFEKPGDADGDNRYEVRLHRAPASHGASAMAVTVRVQDRDEPGRAVAAPGRPVVGEPVTVRLTDPDLAAGADPAATVYWERWQSPGIWQAIPEAAGLRYTPTPADAGRVLRAVVSYADRHGPGRRAVATLAHATLGPMLTALDARADSSRAAGEGEDVSLRPAFDPRIRHYGLPCEERDVMTVAFAAPLGVRVSVNGIQPRTGMSPGPEGSAAVTVAPDSDVAVTVAAADGGSYTTYTIHCMPPKLWALGPAHGLLDVLLAVTASPWVAVIDDHGVSRVHGRAEHGQTGFFLRPFGSGTEQRYAHVEGRTDGKRRWRVLDRNLVVLRRVTTATPLTTTGLHDFRLLEDDSALLMTYEPAVRDFSHLSFPDPDGKTWGSAVETRDSAIQWLGPDGAVRWTWNSWGRLPLEDCAQHRFPDDYAHINSLQWTQWGVLASLRGCSTIVMLDPDAPAGEEIVWRLGASNLAPADWARRGLGPPPLPIVGDPEGEFCGQHAAQLLPPPPGLALPRLLLFDNGVACVTDPHTGEPLGRQPEVYSRAVEYALDFQHGEAIFVRHHALGNGQDSLGFAGGHVALLPDGDWLVSWGHGGRQTTRQPAEGGGNPPADLVTRVNPETGAESFRIPAAQSKSRVRPLPVSPLAILPAPGRLDVVLPDPPPPSHGGAGKAFPITVSFSRPVSTFGVDTPSIQVSGGQLTGVKTLTAFGRPAHSYELTLTPAGNDPLCLSLRPQIGCGASGGGICTADGTRLSGVPPNPVAIPGRAAATSQPLAGDCP